MLLPVDSPSYQPLDATPLTLVDTAEQLQALSRTLDSLEEFAVDLEVCARTPTLTAPKSLKIHSPVLGDLDGFEETAPEWHHNLTWG